VRAPTSTIGIAPNSSETHATASGTPLDDDRRDHREHDCRDQPAHRARRRRNACVVGRDRGELLLARLCTLAPERLHVEHQIEPQHSQQEAAAGADERGHRLATYTLIGTMSRDHSLR
jgi:hypothetical protein